MPRTLPRKIKTFLHSEFSSHEDINISNNDNLLSDESNGGDFSKNYDETSNHHSSRSKKGQNAEPNKPRRRSKSATIKVTTTDCDRDLHAPRSKKYNLRNRQKSASVERSPIIPKIEKNSTPSFLRYPKVGESIISLSGSPVTANGGASEGSANIAIPIADGVLVMQPVRIKKVDSNMMASRIDKNTMAQLKQIQTSISTLISTVSTLNETLKQNT